MGLDTLKMEQTLVAELTAEQIAECYASFKYFHNNIYPLSYVDEKFLTGAHMDNWCDMYQFSQNTCILAPRKHSKSDTLYSWAMWQMMKDMDRNKETIYMSFKESLASWHIANLKKRIQNNRYFSELVDLTSAEGIAKYRWPNGKIHIIRPDGILAFKRGLHTDDAIFDDVLMDPTTMLDLAVIEKVNRRIKEEAISIPREGGQIKIIGTAQTPIDFFFGLKDHPRFKKGWGIFPAITDWKKKTVLWPQRFPYERLMEIRQYETGEKGFQKEYMLKPVWSADSYFTEKEIYGCVSDDLKQIIELKTKNEVVGGWDLGKKAHPTHLSVFEFVPIGQGILLAVQRFQRFLDKVDYSKQLEYVKVITDKFRVDYWNYDNTRGELEGFYEKGEMDNMKFFPKNFNVKYKNKIATEFEKRVKFVNKEGKSAPTIQLINNKRMIDQILVVTNDLQAIQTHEGHGDSFWSISLALDIKKQGGFFPLEDPENLTGMMR